MALPIAQPSRNILRALEDFFEQQKNHPNKSKQEILQNITMKYDLSPIDCEALSHQLLTKK